MSYQVILSKVDLDIVKLKKRKESVNSVHDDPHSGMLTHPIKQVINVRAKR